MEKSISSSLQLHLIPGRCIPDVEPLDLLKADKACERLPEQHKNPFKKSSSLGLMSSINDQETSLILTSLKTVLSSNVLHMIYLGLFSVFFVDIMRSLCRRHLLINKDIS